MEFVELEVLYCEVQYWIQHFKCGLAAAVEREEKESLSPPAINPLPRVAQNTFGLLCCNDTLLLNILSSRSSWSLLAELLSSPLASRVYHCLGLFLTGCRIWDLPFLNFKSLSKLQRSLWIVVQPSGSISNSFQFYVICKLAEGVPSLTVQVTGKDVKQCWTQSNPCGVTQGTGVQLDFVILITILETCQSSQFSVHLTLYSSSLYFISFSVRILGKKVSKTPSYSQDKQHPLVSLDLPS
ncbi:hypothetical protein WISP_52716 [Willisornis vidua]|uniref:Uncharacterized protein n=1 Tax=Willisornis vidua TaxID=1566151 RepID=A0ABQ9DD96_9PASS|nr:hypothetical protein WISP_52716 [Willisornis vidua]